MAAITSMIMAGAAVAGAATSIAGSMKSSSAAGQQAGYSMDIAAQEQKQDQLRAQAMEISASRQQTEILRNNQRARALALSNATNQGASYGSTSGLKGGMGQIEGQTNFNLTGLADNLTMGRQMFGLNANISQDRIGIAKAGGQLAQGQGLSSMGSSLMGAAGAAGRLGGGFGGGSPSAMSFTDFGTGQGAWPMFT